jgi:hypothetical protein
MRVALPLWRRLLRLCCARLHAVYSPGSCGLRGHGWQSRRAGAGHPLGKRQDQFTFGFWSLTERLCQRWAEPPAIASIFETTRDSQPAIKTTTAMGKGSDIIGRVIWGARLVMHNAVKAPGDLPFHEVAVWFGEARMGHLVE